MKRMISYKALPVLCLAVALLTLSACKGKQEEESTVPPAAEPASKGQALFLNHCVSCHMGDGQPPGPNVIIVESKRLGTEASFKEVLRRPPSAMMPSFDSSTLNDADVHELYTYLQSVRNTQHQ